MPIVVENCLPIPRSELVIRPLGERGRYVVKDPRNGSYFQLGEQEHFLLTQLDGRQEADAICAAFEERFGQPLSEEDLDEFLALARSRGLVEEAESRVPRPESRVGYERGAFHATGDRGLGTGHSTVRILRFRQSILYWRKSFWDPDRFFNWLEPKIRFFWTSGFLVISAACIALALVTFWSSQLELAHSFVHALRLETLFWAWLAMFVVIMLHECAHGLTCKHYGGEVREIGFLLLFFMPCFYCNVSDAWLFREKSKRLWVTFAGGYFELFLWSLAVFVWKLTVPGSMANYLAFVVLSACGIQSLFNFNPLIKLDGYYLLSDWLEIPNLQQRSHGYVKGQIRRLLWGAPRPAADPRSGALVTYGLLSWVYSLAFLSLMLWGFGQFLGTRWGLAGVIAATLLATLSMRGLIRGLSAGEFRKMITKRYGRTALWVVSLAAAGAALSFLEMEDRVGGTFKVRPAVRAELRAGVSGFLKVVTCDEGDQLSSGALVARLEVPDLVSRLAQKRAEVREAEAKLKMLQTGPRPIEIAEQKKRVERGKVWRDLAEQDLVRTKQALKEELDGQVKQIAARRAEFDVASDLLKRAQGLVERKALSGERLEVAEGNHQVSEARLAEAQAALRALEARGTLLAEAELAEREKELADAQAALTLLEAGTRPEEVEAQAACLARLGVELRHLEEQQSRQAVIAPVSGLVTTAHLKEKVEQFLREGDLICLVENPGGLAVEITVPEQDVAKVQIGQSITLKARALAFEKFAASVERIAPTAAKGDEELQTSVTVYCRLEDPSADLRPGMTGYARIETGSRPAGQILLDRVVRYLRTEFWW